MGREKMPANNVLHLFSDLSAHGVRYCHWKSNEHLTAGLTGDTDLDILIDTADARLAYELMEKNHFVRVLSHPWKQYSAVEDWLGLDADQMLQTHLHVHYRLLTGLKNVKDQYFPFHKLVLDNTIRHERYPEIQVCNPNIELLLLLSRAVLKKSALSAGKAVLNKDSLREYQYLLERTDEEALSGFAGQMFSPSTAKMAVSLCHNPDDWKTFQSFRKALLKELRFQQRSNRFFAECQYLWRMLLYRGSKLIRMPMRLKKKKATGGKLISFIGVDGSGKTTLARFLVNALSWKLDCSYVYLGVGDGKSSLLNRLKKQLYRLKKSKADVGTSEASSAERKHSPHLSAKQKLKKTLSNLVCLSNARYKYRTIRKICKRVNAGEIIVTDRYPQMEFPGIFDGMTITTFPGGGFLCRFNERLARQEKKLFTEMCSVNPDIVVKLVVPLEVSLKRKPCSGKGLDIIRRKIEITELYHYRGSKELVVDSSRDLEDTKREVLSLLWEHL